jgi:hypothetical protein
MMEAAITSRTSVNFYQATRRNNPEYRHLQANPSRTTEMGGGGRRGIIDMYQHEPASTANMQSTKYMKQLFFRS